MPEVRYLKVFKGEPKYNNPNELVGIDGLTKIKAKNFPHIEKGLVVIALVKIEPKLHGEFRIRIPDTSKDYWEMLFKAPNEITWATIKYGDTNSSTTFDTPGAIFCRPLPEQHCYPQDTFACRTSLIP